MTFQDAKTEKGKLRTTRYRSGGNDFEVLIVPQENADFANYKTESAFRGFTDDAAIKYSRNGQFKLWAFSVTGIIPLSDGGFLYHINLA